MGRRLAWYGNSRLDSSDTQPPLSPATVVDLVEHLGEDVNAQTPGEFLATGGTGLRLPGIYSWWVDHGGSRDLSAGLSQPIAPGLIYAGTAGATRSRSGRKSKNTLWGRIRGMHLGGRHEFSTFRLSLGSILANAREEPEIRRAPPDHMDARAPARRSHPLLTTPTPWTPWKPPYSDNWTHPSTSTNGPQARSVDTSQPSDANAAASLVSDELARDGPVCH
jgi:hypothetical protein